MFNWEFIFILICMICGVAAMLYTVVKVPREYSHHPEDCQNNPCREHK